MSQKDLVLSLRKESLTAKQIYENLVDIFGLFAIAYLSVMKILRKTCWAPSDEWRQNLGGQPPDFDHDARFLSVLQSNPNVSVREITHETRIPKSPVFDIICHAPELFCSKLSVRAARLDRDPKKRTCGEVKSAASSPRQCEKVRLAVYLNRG
jgi:hypothetical protein